MACYYGIGYVSGIEQSLQTPIPGDNPVYVVRKDPTQAHQYEEMPNGKYVRTDSQQQPRPDSPEEREFDNPIYGSEILGDDNFDNPLYANDDSALVGTQTVIEGSDGYAIPSSLPKNSYDKIAGDHFTGSTDELLV